MTVAHIHFTADWAPRKRLTQHQTQFIFFVALGSALVFKLLKSIDFAGDLLEDLKGDFFRSFYGTKYEEFQKHHPLAVSPAPGASAGLAAQHAGPGAGASSGGFHVVGSRGTLGALFRASFPKGEFAARAVLTVKTSRSNNQAIGSVEISVLTCPTHSSTCPQVATPERKIMA